MLSLSEIVKKFKSNKIIQANNVWSGDLSCCARKSSEFFKLAKSLIVLQSVKNQILLLKPKASSFGRIRSQQLQFANMAQLIGIVFFSRSFELSCQKKLNVD